MGALNGRVKCHSYGVNPNQVLKAVPQEGTGQVPDLPYLDWHVIPVRLGIQLLVFVSSDF